jgi:hypothetical protein
VGGDIWVLRDQKAYQVMISKNGDLTKRHDVPEGRNLYIECRWLSYSEKIEENRAVCEHARTHTHSLALFLALSLSFEVKNMAVGSLNFMYMCFLKKNSFD